MLKMQLLHMRDVDAQHAAVKALSHLITEVRTPEPLKVPVAVHQKLHRLVPHLP